MTTADAPPDDHRPEGSSRSPISIAILAAVALMPVVIAAGFLTGGAGSGVPGDVAGLRLRGMLDAADTRPTIVLRSGY